MFKKLFWTTLTISITAIIICISCKEKLKAAINDNDLNPSRYTFGFDDLNGYEGRINFKKVTLDSIEYLMFFGTSSTPYGGVSVHVVNLTKERLEIELLKKQLKK